MTDRTRFPHPVYAETVLAPLYAHAKQIYGEPLMRINRAHCVMLAETGVLDRSDAAAIAAALAEIEKSDILEPSDYTGEHEDLFFEVEAALKEALGAELGGKLHVGRSRNDLDHTMLRIVLLARLDDFLARARAMAAALLDAARRNSGKIIVAYTHGQPAQPTTFGHYLSGALETLLRDLDRLEQARKVVDLCPMGAAAITTTGFPIDRARVADLLGFTAPTRNSYASIAGVDYVTATYSALSLTMLHLGRLFQDFQFWTSFEVGQLYVQNALVQVSSIMPQKRNPVPIEHLRYLASTASGQADVMLRAIHNTPFTDMNDSESGVQVTGLTAFQTAGRAVDLFAALLDGVEVRSETVRDNIDRSCITITELADTLVRSDGVSFRQAHEVATAVARSVVAEGRGLSDGLEAFMQSFDRIVGRPTTLDGRAFSDAVSPERFVAVRERFGGPGPVAMAEALSVYDDTLKELEDEATAHFEAQRVASRRLGDSFGALGAQAQKE